MIFRQSFNALRLCLKNKNRKNYFFRGALKIIFLLFMKKIIFILTFLLVSYFTSAQVRYGIEAGYDYNHIEASNIEGENKASFHAGGFIHYWENVESGIYFGRKGMKLTGFDAKYADKIQQLDFYSNYLLLIPFSVSLNNSKLFSDMLRWGVTVNFFASYALDGRGNIMIDGTTVEVKNIYKNQEISVNNSTYSYKAFEPFDYGVSLGLNIVKDDRFVFRLNFPLSLRNRITEYDKKNRFSSISLSLGYMIN
jgi:hypothetical protein